MDHPLVFFNDFNFLRPYLQWIAVFNGFATVWISFRIGATKQDAAFIERKPEPKSLGLKCVVGAYVLFFLSAVIAVKTALSWPTMEPLFWWTFANFGGVFMVEGYRYLMGYNDN